MLAAVSKGMWAVKLLEQNPLIVLNWGCRLTQVVLYIGHEMVVVVLVVHLDYINVYSVCSGLTRLLTAH